MDIVPSAYLETLKRYLRTRRRYERLTHDAGETKKRIKYTRLGGSTRRVWKLRLVPKLRCKIVSPIKLLARIHDAFVDMMTHLVVGNNNTILFGGKRIPNVRPVPSIVCVSDEIVDGNKMVLEIYKHLVSSPELVALLA